MKTRYALVTVVVSAIAAVAIVAPSLHEAQAAELRPGGGEATQVVKNRAVPIRQIGEFDKVFTARLNQAINDNGAGARGFWAFQKTIGPDWFTERWVRFPNTREMSSAEMVKLRNQIGAELKNAASRKVQLSQVAQGEVSANFFVGTIRKVSKADQAVQAR